MHGARAAEIGVLDAVDTFYRSQLVNNPEAFTSRFL
jgi:hypothetical protein